MKKICFIASAVYSIGGEQSVLTLLANKLSETYDVTIYTHENKCKSEELLSKLDSKINVIYVPHFYHGILFYFVTFINHFWKRILKCEFAQYLMKKAYYPSKLLDYWIKEINTKGYNWVITVSGSQSYSIMLGYIRKKICAKVIAWEHSSYEAYFSYPSSYYYTRKSTFIKEINKLDKCVVLNNDIAKKYEENLNIKADVIFNPCNSITEYQSDCCNKRFIACGRFEEEKGYEGLIDAFYLFSKENLEWKLYLVGDGSRYKAIKKKIEGYNLQERIILTGYQSDVYKYYEQSSIFLMTSKWEGFPMTILEAFQTGLPIIAFDIPAMQPLVDNGKEGYLIEYGDYNEFAKKMIKLAHEPNEIQRMSLEVKKKVTLFSLEAIAGQWKELLEG